MSKASKTSILSEVANYYTEKLHAYGETPRGVDWNGEDSQALRFQQLMKITEGQKSFSINDIGCGYGALFEYLSDQAPMSSYLGLDVSEEMISAAQRRYLGNSLAKFITAAEPDRVAEFSVASGIFNVRMGRSDLEWSNYLQGMLDVLNQSSSHGFAFNCLTSYSDKEKMKDYLYYADPCQLFDLCKRRYSKQVALLHNYGLYEFTLLVRKET